MSVQFIAIAALGKNREIGLNGKLPWDIPEEYDHFKMTIKGQYVLIGRKNFELHEKEIAGVKPLVLSRTCPDYFSNMREILEHAEEHSIDKIYVIGGAEIYALTLPYVSEFICSIVDYDGPADTFFPEYLFYEWEILKNENHKNWSLYVMKKRPDY